MLDYKMIVNIALGIVLGMIIVALGGALMHKAGMGGKDRMMYGKDKAMMEDRMMDDSSKMEGEAMMEVNVQ